MPRTAIPRELELLVDVGRCEGEVLAAVAHAEGNAWTISAHGQRDVIATQDHPPSQDFACSCASEGHASGEALGVDSGDALEEPAHSMTRPVQHLRQSCTVELDATGLSVRLDGTTVGLTRTQFSILAYLVQNEGRWVTAGELIRQVLGTHHQPDTSLVRVHVHAIRRRLGAKSPWLESDRRRARGYRWRQFAPAVEEDEAASG